MNINLCPATAKDLREMLEVLREENLFSLLTVATPQRVATTKAATSPGKRGSHLAEIHARSRARREELGIEKAPEANAEELALRETIDAQRAAENLPGINWRINMVAREEALLEHGFDIYAQGESAIPEAGGINYGINLDEVPL